MSDAIKSVLIEDRVFPPPAEFAASARVPNLAAYEALVARARKDPDGYWAEVASELSWSTPWRRVLDWQSPDARWFVGGKTNITVNCLDRHLDGPRKNKAALLFEGEPGDTRVLTYHQLHRAVCQAANALHDLGVRAGDFVAIYLPMIPEAVIAMLACARLGAPHTVVFGGFSAEALADRVRDSKARLIITADGGWRRGAIVPLKANVDHALTHGEGCPTVEHVLVVRRTGHDIDFRVNRDRFWHETVERASPRHAAPAHDSEHPLFSLYTSGTTGKPKGILHTTGGYQVGAYYSSKLVFDLRDDDIFWCTADIGWVTGHSYVVYGPLMNGATVMLYEGAPNQPAPDRFWDVIARWGVTVFYTAPTAIRAFMRWGDEYPARHDLSSLRLLGSVGEPINPEAWMWYRRTIGGDRCPIVDTWWQTETGSIMISPLPGATPTKPGSATRPLPGIEVDVVDKHGVSVGANQGGFLVIKRPWPSMLRTIFGDHPRFEKTYFGEIPGVYFAGDGARRDDDGYFWIMGRVDDVINVAGHRLSTMEVESALVSHPKVAEAAVVGRPDELKGQAIVAFVTPRAGVSADDALAKELRGHVADQIGALARPEEIRFADALPKTRSGKIMRRLLREIASGSTARGDTTTLEDQAVLERLAQSHAGDE
ncbi:MAG: acetate--CoA ligase [Kofleriaceae bacterium]|nr:acetate--CoA ligase [Kofleriaceae bacterium]MBP9171579.1 acetate--CoA ligase [Kofleriaceae bacterium]MBP9861594.1 acetate--CoA ligase [Kofleriaceae bacterium]